MASEFSLWDESASAGADLSAKRYYAVELTAVNTVNVCNNVADVPVGILLNAPRAGETAVYRVLGDANAMVDGSGTTIAVGDFLGTNAAGVLVKKSNPGDFALGRAMEATNAANVVIGVRLTGGCYLPDQRATDEAGPSCGAPLHSE